jgi:hypothetical protein
MDRIIRMGIQRSVVVVALLVGCTGGGSQPTQEGYYERQIQPILTQKCSGNSSGCHGDNGVSPNVSSFEALAQDPATLVVGPDGHSVFLDKAIARSPHAGGGTIAEGSEAYNILAVWIENGASGLTDGL